MNRSLYIQLAGWASASAPNANLVRPKYPVVHVNAMAHFTNSAD